MPYFSPFHPRKLRLSSNQSILLHSASSEPEKRGGKRNSDSKAKRRLTFLGQLTGSAAIREKIQALRCGSIDNLKFTVVCTGCGKKNGHKRNCAFHPSHIPHSSSNSISSSSSIPGPSLPLSMTEPNLDSSSNAKLSSILKECKNIAISVFESKIQKLLLDSALVGTSTRKTNSARPVPYPSYIYQFPDPTLEDNFSHDMFSSAEKLQYYSFLSNYAEIFVWDPIRQSRHLLSHKLKQLKLLECPLGHDLTFDGWNYDNLKWVFSLEGKLRFVFISRFKCVICSKSADSQSRFDSSASFFINRLPPFLTQKFPLVLGNKRGCFSKEFLQAAHSLRVGSHISIDSIHSVHRECVSNNLLSSSIVCFSLISYLLGLKEILVHNSLVKNFKVITPVLWRRDNEMAISAKRINKYLIRDLQSLEMLYIASFESIQCKILRYDHTFKVASMVQVIKRSAAADSDSFDYHHSLPYSAVLTTMNEEQKIPFFSFVVSKSLSEIEDSLYSLTHRSPTVCIVGDNPKADSHFFERILGKNIQFSRDIFHVFQDLFRECLPSRQTERKQFMSELWFIFFSLHKPDLKFYKEHYWNQLTKENPDISVDQKIQSWENHQNSTSFFRSAIHSHRVRTVLNSGDRITSGLKLLIEKYNPNEETTLFKPSIHSLYSSLEKQVKDGFFLPLTETSGLSEYSNIGTDISPYWISNRSTSQLENYHQLIHHVLSGVSSPSVAHLILVAFTFRFNSNKENRLFHFADKNMRAHSFDPRLFNSLRDSILSLENKQKSEESPCFPGPIFDEIAEYSQIPTTIALIKSKPSLQVGIYRDKWRYSMARLAFESEELNSDQVQNLSTFLEQHFPLHSSSSSQTVIDSYRSLSRKMNLTDLPIRSDFVSHAGERALIRQLLNEPRFLIPNSSRSQFLKPADFLRKYDIYQLTMEYNLKILRSFSFRDEQVQIEDVQIPRRFVESRSCPAESADELINFPLSAFTLKEVEHIREYILIYADLILRDTSQQMKTNSISVAEAKRKTVLELQNSNLSISDLSTPTPLSCKRARTNSSSVVTSVSSSSEHKPSIKKVKVSSSSVSSHSISSLLPPSSSQISLASLTSTPFPSSHPIIAAIIPSQSHAGIELPAASFPPAPLVKTKYSSRIPCPCCKQITHKTVCNAYLLGFNENGEWTGQVKRHSKREKRLHACYRVWLQTNPSSLSAADQTNSNANT
jgi:hypothetical protein